MGSDATRHTETATVDTAAPDTAAPDTAAPDTAALDALARVIEGRRTNLRIDPDRPVDEALLVRLCTLATWAPNHKRTDPWRFAVLTGDARRRIGHLTAEHQATMTSDEEKLDKTRRKYERSAAVICVASHSAPDADDNRRAEDRDAVAAGVQNLLLAATAAGLNSYWGTGLVTAVPAVKALCGFDADDTIVAVVYIGWPIGDVPDPGRATPVINYVH